MNQKDNSKEKPGSCDPMSETEIDDSLAESFPASDPPPWTLGVEPHCQTGEEHKQEGGEPSSKSQISDRAVSEGHTQR
jgi:hypothetical protein